MKSFKFDTPSNKTCSTSSELLIDLGNHTDKPIYKFVEFVNISDSYVFLAFSGHNAELSKGTPISPNGGVFTMPDPFLRNAEAINIIGVTGGEIITITTAR